MVVMTAPNLPNFNIVEQVTQSKADGCSRHVVPVTVVGFIHQRRSANRGPSFELQCVGLRENG